MVGAAGWLVDLPTRIAELAEDWGLSIGAAFGDATEALVAEATLDDGTAAVLKLLVPRPDESGMVRADRAEATVLRLAGGRGCARLLRSDDERGALLLERLGPSLFELDLPIAQRHRILCDCALRLWQPAPDSGLMTGAAKGQRLIDALTTRWEELDRPCTSRAVDHAVQCALRRIAAHHDEQAVLVHGDLHQWNVLRVVDDAGSVCGHGARGGYKLIDPDGLLAEPAYDLGIVMREDPVELLEGDPMERARRLGVRCEVDPAAIWEWGVVERVSTGLLLTAIDLQPVAGQMLLAADRLAEARVG
jgi:streptomycin 6-kinase